MSKSLKALFFIVFLTLLLLLGASKLIFSQLLVVKNVTCQLNAASCPPEVMVKLTALNQRSIFFTDLENYISRELPNFQIKSIKKALPHNLTLDLEHHNSGYYLKNDNDGQAYVVLSDGKLEKINDPQGTGFILKSSLANLTMTKNVDPAFVSKLNHMAQSLTAYQWPISQIILLRSDVALMVFPDDLQVIFDPDNSLESLAKLNVIISQADLPSIDLAIKEIDLRYKLPVLRTNHTLAL